MIKIATTQRHVERPVVGLVERKGEGGVSGLPF